MRLLKFVPDNTNIQFLRWRNAATIGSILLIIASIVLVGVRGLNLGVDFVGGQSVRVEFEQMPPIGELRERVNAIGLGEATIQLFDQQIGSGGEVALIRTALPEGGPEVAEQAGRRLVAGVQAAYPQATTGAVETVSGKVSAELLRTGALSLGLALVAISIYIWIRFEWQFGVGALVALFHDMALTFGFFALTQLQFDLYIVGALLTIIGYSLNDTIVVYDRIRENLKKYRKMDITALLNLSINETLARTVMTSLTMLLALAGLWFFGPDVVYGLTIAMLLGVVVGTYSSVYMASPLLIWLKVGPDSFVPQATTAERVTSGETDDGAVV